MRRALSPVVSTVLLIILAVAAVAGLWGVFNGLFGSATGQFNLSSQSSVISVNTFKGSGMILIVILNHGPASISIKNITLTDDSSNDIVIIPNATSTAVITCMQRGSTVCPAGTIPTYPTKGGNGKIIGGSSVGWSVGNGALVVPEGQQASFQFVISSGMALHFSPNTNYRMLVWPYSGPLTYLTVTAQSE